MDSSDCQDGTHAVLGHDTELDAAELRYTRYLARPARRNGSARTFDLDNSRVTLVPSSNLATLLPGEQAPTLPSFVAYAVTVRNLDATRSLLHERGFPIATTASGDIFVPAASALGAAIIFRQATS